MKRFTYLLLMALVFSTGANAAQLYPLKFHWFKNNGTPAVGYMVYTYEAGTTTLKDTFTDTGQTASNTNPVILDSRGEADIFFNGLYKIKICDASDANCETENNWGNGYVTSTIEADPDNLVPNASFEVDIDGDGVADAWILTTNTGGTNTLDTSNQNHAAQSAKFTSTGSGGGYYTSDKFLEISENRTYGFSWLMKSSVADVRNLVQIQYFTAAQAVVSTANVFDESAANPTVWTVKEFSLTPPSTARYAKLVFYGAHSSDATEGSTWYDDVRFIPSEPETGGSLLSVQVFTVSGTWTKPADVNSVRVQLVGGGGAGGGGDGGNNRGAGGGAGGYGESFITSPGSSQTIIIGAAGVPGGASSTGGSGGTTSFGVLVSVTGGIGGPTTGTGGDGGFGGGDINVRGGEGGGGTFGRTSGDGGTSYFGGGGSKGAFGLGQAGSAYGSGGGGTTSAAGGGGGKSGIIIVWEYN